MNRMLTRIDPRVIRLGALGAVVGLGLVSMITFAPGSRNWIGATVFGVFPQVLLLGPMIVTTALERSRRGKEWRPYLLVNGVVALLFAIFCGAVTYSMLPPRPEPVPHAIPVPAGASAAPAEETEAEKARREELSLAQDLVRRLIYRHDIAGALEKFDAFPEDVKTEPEFLLLRGSCHVERRDFDAALKCFREAEKKMPGDAQIQFNIAEVYFVTKKWNDAIVAFKRVTPREGPNAELLRGLVAFKIMLCEEGRGNAADVERIAAENLKDADSVLGAYTKAAMEFRAKNDKEAKATLADASTRFRLNTDLAAWNDTMIEFGYYP
ncbi:tetratricopeptide repeat protein [Luteolibacter soli]|uniref:Tetratricopeptide repeat protein n=1 Tax=Luteolibacter soli TaxID=3135280 RepID=A0ABU9AYT5_9BACT